MDRSRIRLQRHRGSNRRPRHVVRTGRWPDARLRGRWVRPGQVRSAEAIPSKSSDRPYFAGGAEAAARRRGRPHRCRSSHAARRDGGAICDSREPVDRGRRPRRARVGDAALTRARAVLLVSQRGHECAGGAPAQAQRHHARASARGGLGGLDGAEVPGSGARASSGRRRRGLVVPSAGPPRTCTWTPSLPEPSSETAMPSA